MKKFLPASHQFSVNKQAGFTLIELLVVISILAILSVIGFAAFGGLTGRGNDARRVGDIKAFADAMEVKRSTGTAYVTVAATDFATGKFPSEPTSRGEKYCYKDSTTAVVPNTAVADWTAVGFDTCPAGWANVSGSAPVVASGATFFKFCTINQAKTDVVCQGSKQ